MRKYLYKIYSVDIDAWTSEMELMHDYIKIYKDKVYFFSRGEEKLEPVDDIPEEIRSWAGNCEALFLLQDNDRLNLKNAKKAQKQLETDFKQELDKALAEVSEEVNSDG